MAKNKPPDYLKLAFENPDPPPKAAKQPPPIGNTQVTDPARLYNALAH
ncbi:MAG TPA: hypothetical protein VG102_02730 [Candidatus Paceibacterota bacterium]|jgi:hypothetical protein|nr:hypothetical protein [Candidatus Paceibacterota bacterium]